MKPDYKIHLEKMKEEIATRNTYHGNRISQSLMDMLVIEVRENGAGILAPYWFGVTQKGRGPRRSTKDTGLWLKIYDWMNRKGLFKSSTSKSRINEAKSLTWYINKHGNEQFRKQIYNDIYESARQKCEKAVMAEYSLVITKITKDIL